MTEQSSRVRLSAGLLGCILVVALPAEVSAIPAFARKYKTSCQTCHTAFPQLNPFGEAFRLNGYRFPGGLDVDYAKVEEVELGAEGYKKVWPNAVWPTTLTWVPPISVLLEGEATYTPNPSGRPATTLNGLGGKAAILGAGTLGESFSYFVELEFTDSPKTGDDVVEETAIERSFIIYRPFEKPLLNFKVGEFEPGVSDISNHRRLNRSTYFLTKDARPGANDFSLEDANRGVEAFGITGMGRMIYNLGVIEGNRDFEPISEKDIYLRLGYKIGGLRLDGQVEDGDKLMQNPRPWAERSLMISVSGLTGAANIDDTSVGGDGRRDQFNMLIADLRSIFEDATVTVGGNLRSDDEGLPTSASHADRVNSSNVFAEAQYVVFPWFIPSVRFEDFNQSFEHSHRRVDVTLNFLARANVKTTLFYVYDTSVENNDKEELGGDNHNIFGIGLHLAF
jgi:hypothetical protein